MTQGSTVAPAGPVVTSAPIAPLVPDGAPAVPPAAANCIPALPATADITPGAAEPSVPLVNGIIVQSGGDGLNGTAARSCENTDGPVNDVPQLPSTSAATARLLTATAQQLTNTRSVTPRALRYRDEEFGSSSTTPLLAPGTNPPPSIQGTARGLSQFKTPVRTPFSSQQTSGINACVNSIYDYYLLNFLSPRIITHI